MKRLLPLLYSALLKKVLLLISSVLCSAILTAQTQYDYYDDSTVSGGASRVLSGIILFLLLIVGVLVFLLIVVGYYKIKYWFNPEESPKYKAALKSKEIEAQRLNEKKEPQKQAITRTEKEKEKKTTDMKPPILKEGFTLSTDGTILIKCSDVEECHIPYGVKVISSKAFKDAKQIKTLYIPNSVEEVESSAFSWLSVETVYIPNSVNKWGWYAFSYCTKLKEVIIEDGLPKLGVSMFEGCKNLEAINLPSSITFLPDGAFRFCKKIKMKELPPNLSYIGEYAFYECERLTTITIPSSVVGIHDDTFGYCSKLSSVNFSEGLVVISSGSFKDCSKIKRIRIPATLQHIDTDCFGDECAIILEVPKGMATYYRELNIEGVNNIVEYDTEMPKNIEELKEKCRSFILSQNEKRKMQENDFLKDIGLTPIEDREEEYLSFIEDELERERNQDTGLF